MNSLSPVELKQMGKQHLGIIWNDGHNSLLNVRKLRLSCRCANCIDEWTREVIVKDEAIPQDVRPVKIDSVGRYALKISWTDGHDTGIYTFDLLRKQCECPQCKSR